MKRKPILILLATVALAVAACDRGAATDTSPAATGDLPATPPTTEAADATTPAAEAAAPTLPAEAPEANAEEGIGGGGESLVITEQHMFVDQFNRWQVVGEVRNDSSAPLTSVELLVDIRGASDTPLYTDVTSLLVASVPPGGAAPFTYTVNDPTITPENAIVTITSSAPADATPVALDVVSTNMIQDDFGDFHCTGEIVNNSGVPVDVDGLAAAIIDTRGRIASADWFWAVAQHLEPGASSPFRASPIGPVADPSECRVYVDARQAESIAGYDVQVLSSRYYRDVFDTGHLVGEVRNDGAETLIVQLVAGLYDVSGRVVDADITSIPQAVAPGETASFDFTTLSATNYALEAASAFASTRVIVDSFWTYPAFTEQGLLVVDNFAASVDEGSVLVTGDVVNNQTFTAEFIVIAVRFRDAAGAVIAQGNASVFEPIPPGASAPFDMRVYLPPDVDVGTISPEVVAKTDVPT